MPLFINRDQIFAHQVHLLEHKLRSKEERILELETENALLHLRLAECRSKLRRVQEEETRAQKQYQHQRSVHKISFSTLSKLLAEVQVLKKELRDVFALYVGFATDLEGHSKLLLEQVSSVNCAIQGHHGDNMQALQTEVASLERSLQEEKERSKTERMRRRVLHNTLVELRGNIRVHCRVRPVLPFDSMQWSPSSSGSTSAEEMVQAFSDDTVFVNCAKTGSPVTSKLFEFERVHGPDDSQDAVFAEVKPLLTSLLDGYNACIMAYGQTGSGKTHTMIGSQPKDPTGTEQDAYQGIVPKAAAELFKLLSEKPEDSHTVELSVVEVYNNEVLDLLGRDEEGAATGVKRDVITTSTGVSEVPALTHELVRSSSEVMQLISAVLRLRAHYPNLVHRDSSRSHLIVTLTVTSRSPGALALARRLQRVRQDVPQKEWWSPRCRRAASSHRPREDPTSSPASSPCLSPCYSPCASPRPSLAQSPLRTRLQLVDLAGSECVGMSGVSGAALWETSCINRSLSALSDVLGALAEQRPHVPYRNSKLTHLLQDSIGGDAKLLVMLCVSPTQHFLTESLQTLGFGSRARQVQREPPRRKTRRTQN